MSNDHSQHNISIRTSLFNVILHSLATNSENICPLYKNASNVIIKYIILMMSIGKQKIEKENMKDIYCVYCQHKRNKMTVIYLHYLHSFATNSKIYVHYIKIQMS